MKLLLFVVDCFCFFFKALSRMLCIIVVLVVVLYFYLLELLKSMRKLSFYKEFPVSCFLAALVFVLSFMPAWDMPTHDQLGIDKLVCSSYYFFMTTVFWLEYIKKKNMKVIDYNWAWFPCVICPLLLSGAIELIQQFLIPSRQGEWLDFVFNAIGVFSSAIVWSSIYARRKGVVILFDPFNFED